MNKPCEYTNERHERVCPAMAAEGHHVCAAHLAKLHGAQPMPGLRRSANLDVDLLPWEPQELVMLAELRERGK